ncbi:hypothetical protein C0Q70_14452 [Pomacea canaliculata]|uniref:Rhodanese domain-containing protein n=1 Tax=Pomacea canaliculata TaxID=400727 RepID=A0A2T7P019_POMCA|nr:thiosulfate sulfurtransferase-like isoform X1 [Pomacea canaliculata]XP_025103760.1 thiosulfate sulfurtransferase-like isoform X1 [Pomacea canaliculata]PVD26774.1 hypothetical protein C0Q70_14452 [Pomacea canaliculata]
MTIARLGTLVTTHWLRDQLLALTAGSKKRPLRVLDASASPDPQVDGYKEFYMESHIPEAVYFSLHGLCPASPTSLHKYPIPDSNRFQDYVEGLGICNNTHVVTYDRSNTAFALKTWWLFRLFGHEKVSVLDGGFRKWLLDGYDVTVEVPKVERSNFNPSFNAQLVRDFEAMAHNLKAKSWQVADAREPEEFFGTEASGTGGHIPGACNIPYSTLFEDKGTFKPPQELKKLFDAENIDLGKPLVATCQTAMTACGIAAAAHLLGKEMVPVYNGAFREWSQRAEPHQIVTD